jgi:GT2 family glycosyltransferase
MKLSAAASPLVSVIVPHFDDLANLEKCLSALERQTFARGQFEIVVADNQSSCGPERVDQTIAGRARLVVVSERGAGPARNGGAAAARGRTFAFTDSDCVPAPDWLEEGLTALADYDFVGGRVDVSVADERSVTPTEAFEKVFAFDFETYINRKGFTGSGNLFVPRAIFEAVGGFRNAVSEDVDWSRRAVAQGYRLGYAPGAIVTHPARRNWDELRRKWSRINRETFALQQQAPAGRLRWLMRTMLLPASAVAHTPRVLRSPRLSNGRERSGALAVLFLCRAWRFGDALMLGLAARK